MEAAPSTTAIKAAAKPLDFARVFSRNLIIILRVERID